jgi:hypothetical protein
MYTLVYDAKAGFIRMTVWGFWTVETVHALFAELLPMMARVKASGKPVLVISDASQFPVQSAEVGVTFNRLDPEAKRMRERMAMVVGSTLNKMQARRFAVPDIEFFSSIEEAEHWLRFGTFLDEIRQQA